MDEINDLKRTVSKFQMAQLNICNAIVELLIERGVCSEEQAHRKFQDAALETALSDASLEGAEIVLSMCEFLEDAYDHLPKARKPS